MAVFDARPSAFTQLSTIGEWENLWSASGGVSAVDGPAACTASFDVPGRNIVMAAGNVAIKGQLWRCDATVSTAIPSASAQNRMDRLVLRYNRGATSSPTVIVPTIIPGTPSGSPTLPSLTRTPTGIWDFPICYWTSQSNGALVSLTDNRELIANDVWHSIAPPVNWFGGVNYKMNPDYTVTLAGMVQLPFSGSYNTAVIANLPPIYCPIGDKRFLFLCTTQSPDYGNVSGGMPELTVRTDGRVQVSAIPSGLSGMVTYIDGINYPLDF